MRLGSMPLAETTTSDVVLKKGEVAKRQSEAAEKKLLHSLLLDEERVLFPGDPDGYELNWLGNAPFMQVQADGGFGQSSGQYSGSQRSSAPDYNCPQALALHVKLSDKAFISGFSGKTHLKIEVLFNGQLSACSLVHTNDIRSGAKSLHQVFAGYRVDFLAERPWILLPPYTTPDGGTRRFRKTISSSERWEQISAALLREAEERGTDRDGESPSSAEFLRALATMQMPERVKDMQKPGGRKFGVVDVVITAGLGSKLTTGTNYLKSPQRLKDSNYAVRAKGSPKHEAVVVCSNQTQEAAGDLERMKGLELVNSEADAEEDSDMQHERPHKRRVLSPKDILSRPRSYKLDFQSPFSGAQIPYLPPPKFSSTQNDLSPIAGRVSSRCPSPEHRSDGHKEPLPSNDCDRNYQETGGTQKAQDWSSDASRIFHEYHSPPPNLQSSASQVHTMRPSMTTLPFSEPMARHETFSGSFITPASVSSPMMQDFGSYSAPLTQPTLPDGIDTPISTTPGPSTPYVAPTALMHPTTADWKGLPTAMATPYYSPTHLPQQTPLGSYSPGLVPYMPSNGLLSLLPQTPPFFGHSAPAQYATPVTPSPATFQSSGPLPPTGIFTVTSRPRRSAIPMRDAALIDSNWSRPSILVSRLVITGLNGTLIVDHHWLVAQRITVNRGRSEEFVTEDREEMLGSDYDEPTSRSRTQKQSNSRHSISRARSRPSSPSKSLQPDVFEQNMYEQRRDSIQDGQTNHLHITSLPYLKKHQGPMDEEMLANPQIDVPDKIAIFVSASILSNMATTTLTRKSTSILPSASPTHSKILQRRNFSRSGLSGLQGPKAATFLLDDPEEVLREAARTKRSKSPAKPVFTSCISPTTPPAQIDLTTDQSGPSNSSPLSSVPSSPVPEGASKLPVITDTAMDSIPQLDGSPERTIPATLPRKQQIPSPTKSSFPISKFRRPVPAAPQPNISPESRKRKASQRSPTKPPRSPDRLKTASNPPLNDDCVIAFAESEDKDNEKGVLRQVKGERQGVFREEYVVLAVRFFIAGD